jgi:hypothetical protein
MLYMIVEIKYPGGLEQKQEHHRRVLITCSGRIAGTKLDGLRQFCPSR